MKGIIAAVSLVFSPFAFGQTQGNAGDQVLVQEEAQGQGAALRISPAQVRQIQQSLNQRGYDVGSVDGTWGPSTQKAVRNFQQAVGLEPTGQPNLHTLAQLGIDITQTPGQQQNLGRTPAAVQGQQNRQGQQLNQQGQAPNQQGQGQQNMNQNRNMNQ